MCIRDSDAHIAQYVNIIADLRHEISALKAERRAAPKLPAINNPNRSDTDDHERIEMEKLRGAIAGNYREKREVKAQLLELNDLNLNSESPAACFPCLLSLPAFCADATGEPRCR